MVSPYAAQIKMGKPRRQDMAYPVEYRQERIPQLPQPRDPGNNAGMILLFLLICALVTVVGYMLGIIQ